jgi:hypothetical protein
MHHRIHRSLWMELFFTDSFRETLDPVGFQANSGETEPRSSPRRSSREIRRAVSSRAGRKGRCWSFDVRKVCTSTRDGRQGAGELENSRV